MNEKKIKTYDKVMLMKKKLLTVSEKMKLLYNYARYKLHKSNVEELIGDYEKLINCVKRFNPNTFQFMRN